MPRRQDNPYAPHDWAPHEKPALLGSPSTPLHSPAKRLAYGVVGLLVCLTGALGNAVVTANLQLLQGTFAAWSTEIAWLPAVYVMTNVSINLLLVKFRQQFGLRAFTEGFLVLYVLVTFFHLFVNDLSSAMMVRAAHGMVAAALSSLGIYYQVQAWPARHRLKGLTIGITGSSLAIPLARLFSTELLQTAPPVSSRSEDSEVTLPWDSTIPSPTSPVNMTSRYTATPTMICTVPPIFSRM